MSCNYCNRRRVNLSRNKNLEQQTENTEFVSASSNMSIYRSSSSRVSSNSSSSTPANPALFIGQSRRRTPKPQDVPVMRNEQVLEEGSRSTVKIDTTANSQYGVTFAGINQGITNGVMNQVRELF